MNTIVSEKGQVTIPKPLRERLGIRPGQILDFSEEQGRLVATKVTPQDPVDSLYGILKLGRPTDDAITALRGKADAAVITALAASKAWKVYRSRGGQRERVVTDFLIGAHASSQAERLLTRDRGFYRTCFARLRVLDPLTF